MTEDRRAEFSVSAPKMTGVDGDLISKRDQFVRDLARKGMSAKQIRRSLSETSLPFLSEPEIVRLTGCVRKHA